jgi:hypothetical protein
VGWALALASVAHANSPSIVIGMGNKSCGVWLAAKVEGTQAAYEEWVAGFISGYDLGRQTPKDMPGILAGTDINGIIASVDAYCRSHPSDDLDDATQGALQTLNSRQAEKWRQDLKAKAAAQKAGSQPTH